MHSPEEKMKEKYEELKIKLKTEKPIPMLSEAAMRIFCVGFHLPLTGSLYYLLEKTTAYLEIGCIAKVQHGATYSIMNFQDYEVFAKGIENIIPSTIIDFTFSLTKSIYNVNGISMSDINVMFSVYFLLDKYEVVYSKNKDEEIRFVKRYNEDIEPNEIRQLRDAICNNIFDRVTKNIEDVLSVS